MFPFQLKHEWFLRGSNFTWPWGHGHDMLTMLLSEQLKLPKLSANSPTQLFQESGTLVPLTFHGFLEHGLASSIAWGLERLVAYTASGTTIACPIAQALSKCMELDLPGGGKLNYVGDFLWSKNGHREGVCNIGFHEDLPAWGYVVWISRLRPRQKWWWNFWMLFYCRVVFFLSFFHLSFFLNSWVKNTSVANKFTDGCKPYPWSISKWWSWQWFCNF